MEQKDFNSYGARRGNHEIMMRGTFANIRIKNELVAPQEGGYTKFNGEVTSIYDAAMKYMDQNIDLVIIAGSEYGTGSSRDWAAKGTKLLGIKAVIAESFERIHRSNLVGMGVLPLIFQNNENRKNLNLINTKSISIIGLNNITPKSKVQAVIEYLDNSQKKIELLCRIDTEEELSYYKHGGILQYTLLK